MQNYGKAFEAKLKSDFLKIPGSTIDRLTDSMSGFLSISNISDFIGYKKPNIFYLECKSVHGNTFPVGNLTQADKLKTKIGVPGARAGVVIWFVDHKRVVFCPIKSFIHLRDVDGLKSININKTDFNKYRIIEIPAIKVKQVFIDSDYTILTKLEDDYGDTRD